MLNEQFILHRISPYLDSNRALSEFEFMELFSELELHEQYEVVNLLIKNNIELVREKEEETRKLDNVKILHMDNDEKNYRKLMQLTNEQLCVMFQQGDSAALAALLEKNKRFVYQLALQLKKEYRQYSLTEEDLYMEGNLGLIEAAKRFDVTLDYKFSTYSWHWIRQKIIRGTIDTGYMIRIPVHVFEKIIRVNNCRKRHSTASLDQLLEYLQYEDQMELSLGQLEKLIAYSDIYLNTSSLNDVVGEEGDTEIIEFIPDERLDTESIVLGECLKKDLKEVLSSLSDRERNVLDMRFGLSSGSEMTLEQVGEVYGLTRERIRQIEAKAIKKLAHPCQSRKLRDYV